MYGERWCCIISISLLSQRPIEHVNVLIVENREWTEQKWKELCHFNKLRCVCVCDQMICARRSMIVESIFRSRGIFRLSAATTHNYLNYINNKIKCKMNGHEHLAYMQYPTGIFFLIHLFKILRNYHYLVIIISWCVRSIVRIIILNNNNRVHLLCVHFSLVKETCCLSAPRRYWTPPDVILFI